MFSKDQKDFLTKFFPLFIGAYLLVHLLPLEFVNQAIAAFQTHLLQSLGMNAHASGSLISTATVDFHIIIDCSGLVMSILFACLVLSTPVRRKMRAIAIGIPALLIVNQMRLLATMLIGIQFGATALDTAHFILWFFDGALVLALWFAELKWEENARVEKRKK